MLKYDQTIQIRCTIEEKALFHEKGGSEFFREWLNAGNEAAPATPHPTSVLGRHSVTCNCVNCVADRKKL